MIAAKISINDKGVRDLLDELERKVTDRRQIMRQIAEDMKDAVEENFEQEGRPKWQSLSSRTIAARKKKGTWPGKILQQSGKLAKVSTKVTNDEAIVGSGMPYAAAQQLGIDRTVAVRAHMQRRKDRNIYATTRKGTQGRKIASGVAAIGSHTRHMKIPARPFLQLTDGDIEGIKNRIRNYLMGR